MFQIISCTKSHLRWKFHENLSSRFVVMLLIDRQTNTQMYNDENITFWHSAEVTILANKAIFLKELPSNLRENVSISAMSDLAEVVSFESYALFLCSQFAWNCPRFDPSMMKYPPFSCWNHNIPEKLDQYHGCWCPGSLHYQPPCGWLCKILFLANVSQLQLPSLYKEDTKNTNTSVYFLKWIQHDNG